MIDWAFPFFFFLGPILTHSTRTQSSSDARAQAGGAKEKEFEDLRRQISFGPFEPFSALKRKEREREKKETSASIDPYHWDFVRYLLPFDN